MVRQRPHIVLPSQNPREHRNHQPPRPESDQPQPHVLESHHRRRRQHGPALGATSHAAPSFVWWHDYRFCPLDRRIGHVRPGQHEHYCKQSRGSIDFRLLHVLRYDYALAYLYTMEVFPYLQRSKGMAVMLIVNRVTFAK